MTFSVFYSVDTWIIALTQFMLMLAFIRVGRWAAKNRAQDQAENPGNAAITASLYGLLGLLIAFTFGMSGNQFKERKHAIIIEANYIGTAISRIQLYPDSVQPKLRQHFSDYLESRIAYYEASRDTTMIRNAVNDGKSKGKEIWKIVASQSRLPGNLIPSNHMTPALNQMLDIATSVFWSEYNRTPAPILVMLFFLSLSAAFVVGFTSMGKGKFDWPMGIGFCFLTTLVIATIIDLDKPRAGLIKTEDNVRAIINLRNTLEPLN
jgi:hypothetical protein